MAKLTVQLIAAIFLTVVGVVLLFIGLLMPPAGAIDSSVLVAFGETATFAGALFGVDYRYRYKQKQQGQE